MKKLDHLVVKLIAADQEGMDVEIWGYRQGKHDISEYDIGSLGKVLHVFPNTRVPNRWTVVYEGHILARPGDTIKRVK
jgi:hypothetical protein